MRLNEEGALDTSFPSPQFRVDGWGWASFGPAKLIPFGHDLYCIGDFLAVNKLFRWHIARFRTDSNTEGALGLRLDSGRDYSFPVFESGVFEKDGVATIKVHRFGPTAQPLRISYATRDGTARSGEQYQATEGVLLFEPGQTEQTFTVPIFSDGVFRANSDFYVMLSEPSPQADLPPPLKIGIYDSTTGIMSSSVHITDETIDFIVTGGPYLPEDLLIRQTTDFRTWKELRPTDGLGINDLIWLELPRPLQGPNAFFQIRVSNSK
jgi:hypothetical protein